MWDNYFRWSADKTATHQQVTSLKHVGMGFEAALIDCDGAHRDGCIARA